MIVLGLVAALFAFTGCGSDTLNVFNWGDYIDEEVLGIFTEQTGIQVNYQNFATNEEMYTKIKNGGSEYDVLFPSDYMINKMIKEDMLEKLDMQNIPNIAHIGDQFRNLSYDPNGEYSVPYMWGTLGILYNTAMVDEAVDSWDILWNAKYENRIFMYESMRDSFTPAFKRLGFSINTTDSAEIDAAKRLLIEQKPIIRAYVGDAVKDSMIGGEGALSLVFSGDAVFCIEENPDLAFAVPKEGSNIWFDAVVVPKGTKHKKEAEAFINFLCDPDIALKNTEYIGYSTVNMTAFENLPQEVQDDPVYWPRLESLGNSEVFLDIGDYIGEYDKAWTEVLASE
jgi:spermidine/putrescine transport system substrate-binding protein